MNRPWDALGDGWPTSPPPPSELQDPPDGHEYDPHTGTHQEVATCSECLRTYLLDELQDCDADGWLCEACLDAEPLGSRQAARAEYLEDSDGAIIR